MKPDRHTPLTALQRAAQTGDPLVTWQRDVVGRTIRLDVPIPDAMALRQAAEILRKLATRFEVLAGGKGEEWHILNAARTEATVAKYGLQAIRRGANEKKAKAMGY